MKLYTYYRSSTAYRVRIALNLKGLDYEAIPIHLTKGGGGQHSAEYRALNPLGRVPSLVLDSGDVLTQSLAIIDYLEETHPNPPLLPADPVQRAQVRAFAQVIACDIHPLNNLITLQYLRRVLKHEQPEIDAWYHHWVIAGIRSARNDGQARALRLRRRGDTGRHLSRAAGVQRPAAEGTARQISETGCGRRRLPGAAGLRRARPENQPDAE